MAGAGNSAKDPVIESLIFDLLQWLANGERTYEDVMEAWRTSCPRLRFGRMLTIAALSPASK